MSRWLGAIGDRLPLAVGIALLAGAASLLLDHGDVGQGKTPTPEQVAANIRPIGSVRLAATSPSSQATSTVDATPAEPTLQRPVRQADASTAETAVMPAGRAPQPPLHERTPPVAETAAQAPESSPRTPAEATAAHADATPRPSAQTEAATERETAPPEVLQPPATLAEPARPTRPATATAALKLMRNAGGWHGTYAFTPGGVTLFPYRFRATGPAAAAFAGRQGVFRTMPDGAVYFELVPPSGNR